MDKGHFGGLCRLFLQTHCFTLVHSVHDTAAGAELLKRSDAWRPKCTTEPNPT